MFHGTVKLVAVAGHGHAPPVDPVLRRHAPPVDPVETVARVRFLDGGRVGVELPQDVVDRLRAHAGEQGVLTLHLGARDD